MKYNERGTLHQWHSTNPILMRIVDRYRVGFVAKQAIQKGAKKIQK